MTRWERLYDERERVITAVLLITLMISLVMAVYIVANEKYKMMEELKCTSEELEEILAFIKNSPYTLNDFQHVPMVRKEYKKWKEGKLIWDSNGWGGRTRRELEEANEQRDQYEKILPEERI